MQDEDIPEILSLWGLAPGDWREVASVRSSLGSIARPVLELEGRRYILRRQPADLTEDDTRFRQAFMRHLRACDLPVPELLLRPDGHAYAIVAEGIYELQQWLEGRRYVTGEPGDNDLLEAAATTLGLLHQTSVDFPWRPQVWPDERSPEAVSYAYIDLIQQQAQGERLPQSIGAGLERVAQGCFSRLEQAITALEEPPRPPELHIHGDYQAHNLAFAQVSVSAIYDFDAAHWARRIDELAYSLLYFAGVRWDESPTVTPPLVDDGLDILRLHRFLGAYGREAPPAEGEARLLADAITLAFPVVFANGVAEDLIFAEDFATEPDVTDALARLQWADSFWLWLDRYRDILREAWESA
ncbi:MAG: phosphotransferase enzyme family protein [Ktedonobacterales bacterium]